MSSLLECSLCGATADLVCCNLCGDFHCKEDFRSVKSWRDCLNRARRRRAAIAPGKGTEELAAAVGELVDQVGQIKPTKGESE